MLALLGQTRCPSIGHSGPTRGPGPGTEVHPAVNLEVHMADGNLTWQNPPQKIMHFAPAPCPWHSKLPAVAGSPMPIANCCWCWWRSRRCTGRSPGLAHALPWQRLQAPSVLPLVKNLELTPCFSQVLAQPPDHAHWVSNSLLARPHLNGPPGSAALWPFRWRRPTARQLSCASTAARDSS